MMLELAKTFLGTTAYYFGFHIILERLMLFLLAKEEVTGHNFSQAITVDASPIGYRAWFSLPTGLALALLLSANLGGSEAVQRCGPFAGCLAFAVIEASFRARRANAYWLSGHLRTEATYVRTMLVAAGVLAVGLAVAVVNALWPFLPFKLISQWFASSSRSLWAIAIDVVGGLLVVAAIGPVGKLLVRLRRR